MDRFPAVVAQDDEPEEQTEGQGRDDKEIDGGDLTQVGLEEAATVRFAPAGIRRG